MNNSYNIQKNIKDNIFITCLLIFVVIYIILNYNNLFNTELIYNNIFKSLLITFLIVLILYIIFDDESNIEPDIIDNNLQLKYKIINDGVGSMTPMTKLNNKISYDDNRSIFISQQNNKKFGLNL